MNSTLVLFFFIIFLSLQYSMSFPIHITLPLRGKRIFLRYQLRLEITIVLQNGIASSIMCKFYFSPSTELAENGLSMAILSWKQSIRRKRPPQRLNQTFQGIIGTYSSPPPFRQRVKPQTIMQSMKKLFNRLGNDPLPITPPNSSNIKHRKEQVHIRHKLIIPMNLLLPLERNPNHSHTNYAFFYSINTQNCIDLVVV